MNREILIAELLDLRDRAQHEMQLMDEAIAILRAAATPSKAEPAAGDAGPRQLLTSWRGYLEEVGDAGERVTLSFESFRTVMERCAIMRRTMEQTRAALIEAEAEFTGR